MSLNDFDFIFIRQINSGAKQTIILLIFLLKEREMLRVQKIKEEKLKITYKRKRKKYEKLMPNVNKL